MWSLFNQLWQQSATIFAPPCLLCGAMDASFDNYCAACYADLPHRHPATQPSCQICAVQLGHERATPIICGDCLQHPPAYDKVWVALHYLPPITGLMHAFKDQGQQACGRLLSNCLLRYLQHLDNPPQALIPMPLHPVKQRQRGFNQALVIAQHLGQAMRIPVLHKHCIKTLNTPSQQGQKKHQRIHNLSRAFNVLRPLTDFQHIAIVDDVMTTGSTANALANTLRQAASTDIRISVWCVARTLPPHSQLHLADYE